MEVLSLSSSATTVALFFSHIRGPLLLLRNRWLPPASASTTALSLVAAAALDRAQQRQCHCFSPTPTAASTVAPLSMKPQPSIDFLIRDLSPTLFSFEDPKIRVPLYIDVHIAGLVALSLNLVGTC
ncbi:hypothetical protein BHM03_00062911 [Ensete ventricosum]|nr:hypothetical protein BHM03_00062911 [Ensete ventricosum]